MLSSSFSQNIRCSFYSSCNFYLFMLQFFFAYFDVLDNFLAFHQFSFDLFSFYLVLFLILISYSIWFLDFNKFWCFIYLNRYGWFFSFLVVGFIVCTHFSIDFFSCLFLFACFLFRSPDWYFPYQRFQEAKIGFSYLQDFFQVEC